MLYCLGDKAEAVLASTNVSEDERKVYSTVKKLDDFFKVRKNIIYKCARFNRQLNSRVQQREAVHEQQQTLRGASNTSLEAVHSTNNSRRLNGRGQQRQVELTKTTSHREVVFALWKRTASQREMSCQRSCLPSMPTHWYYSAQCLSKSVSAVTSTVSASPTPFMDTAFMDTMSSSSNMKAWALPSALERKWSISRRRSNFSLKRYLPTPG